MNLLSDVTHKKKKSTKSTKDTKNSGDYADFIRCHFTKNARVQSFFVLFVSFVDKNLLVRNISYYFCWGLRLTMDRTNWQWGGMNINIMFVFMLVDILMLYISYVANKKSAEIEEV